MRQRLLIILCALCLTANVAVAQAQTINEQEMVNFFAVLPAMPLTESRVKVDSLVDGLRSNKQQLDEVLDWAAKYLLDSRSPICNLQLYDSLFVMDRLGCRPMDFNFVDTLGHKSSLYALLKDDILTAVFSDKASEDSASLVLFFYSADCDHCTTLLRWWHEHPEGLPCELRRGHVLAVCLNDDETLWHKSIRFLPKQWTPVRDLDGLIARRRYDLRQLPHTVIINP